MALCGVAALLPGWPTAARAQERSLTLEEAIALAGGHNPSYQAVLNDPGQAAWRLRAAYGSLLPNASTSLGLLYQASGTPVFGSFTAEDVGVGRTPEYYFSDYSLALSYQFDGGTLFRIWQERANRRAVDARVDAAGFTLASDVTRQYLAALRAQAGRELAEQDLARADENYRLAQARVEVGAASPIDSMQAAVERGRTEVALLRADAGLETERLRLEEQVGRTLPDSVRLTTQLPVFEPSWTRDALVALAVQNNPELESSRAAAASARASARAARASYLPNLSLSAVWSGFARESGDPDALLSQAQANAQSRFESCELMNRISAGLSEPLPDRPESCGDPLLTDAQRQRILSRNQVFPFEFADQPLRVMLRVSLPIFQGFSRERDTQAAQATAADAAFASRATELRIRTEVAAALEALSSGYRAVRIETRNRELAETQFRLAQERYRLGAAPYLELRQAETEVARANQAHLDAVYGFQEALVTLESLVGRQLRP